MSCSCTIETDTEQNDFYHDKIVVAKKEHICGECKSIIKIGEKYEYVSAKSDHFFTAKTCLPCKEIRDCFCCTWHFEYVFDYIQDSINEFELNLSGLENLGQDARDKFFNNIRIQP